MLIKNDSGNSCLLLVTHHTLHLIYETKTFVVILVTYYSDLIFVGFKKLNQLTQVFENLSCVNAIGLN